MKYVAKVHVSNGFSVSYIKGECVLDERGEPKQDNEFVYLKVQTIPRKHIRHIEITQVSEDATAQATT